MELSLFMPYILAAVSIATFFIGRQSSSHSAGKEAGEMASNVKHIMESVARVERDTNSNLGELRGQLNSVTIQLSDISGKSNQAHEAAKSAHRRIDDHLSREHDIHVEKRD